MELILIVMHTENILRVQSFSVLILTVHTFTVLVFTVHIFTVLIFTVHTFMVLIFTVHTFTVLIFTVQYTPFQCTHSQFRDSENNTQFKIVNKFQN